MNVCSLLIFDLYGLWKPYKLLSFIIWWTFLPDVSLLHPPPLKQETLWYKPQQPPPPLHITLHALLVNLIKYTCYSDSRSSSCSLRHMATLNSLYTQWKQLPEAEEKTWAWEQPQCLCLHVHVCMTVRNSPAPTQHPFQMPASSLLCRVSLP